MSHGLCAVDADHRIVLFNELVPRDVRPVARRHPGRRVDARRDRSRGAARILSAMPRPSRCGSGGCRRWRPRKPFQQYSQPAQRQRIHPALSSDAGRRLGHAVRGRDRAPPHGARAAPAVRALRPGDQPHVARAVHVRPGRAADRVQRALSRDLRARSRGHQAGRHASRAAGALDRAGQRARHVGRGVLREAQGRGRRQADLDHAAAPEGRQRDRGDVAPDAGRRLGLGARGRHRAPAATRRRCASRTSCSTPRSRTWRTALCVFDKDWRVVVRNRRYLELYGLDPERRAAGHAGDRSGALQPGERRSRSHRAERRGVLRGFQAARRRERRRAGGASPLRRRAADRGAPSADGERRLGLHLRGHHRARARRRGAEGTASPLRYRAQQHGARPVHVRRRHAADREQQALCRDVQPAAGLRAPGHVGARRDRAKPSRSATTATATSPPTSSTTPTSQIAARPAISSCIAISPTGA